MKMPWELAGEPRNWKPGEPPVGARKRLSLQMRLNRFVGNVCPYCGVTMNRDRGWNSRQAPSRDHRIPRARQGTSDPDNLLVCCRGCNEDKGCLTPEEYMAVRAGLASRLDHVWNVRRSMECNPQARGRNG